VTIAGCFVMFACADTIRYDTRCCFNVRSKADMTDGPMSLRVLVICLYKVSVGRLNLSDRTLCL